MPPPLEFVIQLIQVEVHYHMFFIPLQCQNLGSIHISLSLVVNNSLLIQFGKLENFSDQQIITINLPVTYTTFYGVSSGAIWKYPAGGNNTSFNGTTIFNLHILSNNKNLSSFQICGNDWFYYHWITVGY